MFGRGLHVRAPTWDPSGDQTRCPTKLIKQRGLQLTQTPGHSKNRCIIYR